MIFKKYKGMNTLFDRYRGAESIFVFINLFRNRSISSDRRKHYRLGSAVMMAAISAAAITGLVGLVLTKMWNVNFNALNTTTDRNQAMQYVLNSADVARATRYVNLSSSPRAEIPGTDFEREVIVVQDPSLVDTKQATIRVYKGNSDVPVASMVVKKSRVSEVLYDSIGDNTDGAMTQKAATDYFALKDSVLTKDETYNIFLTQARANALLQALEDSVADNYLTKSQAQEIYRKISDSYSKGETDSLLNELKKLVNVNKANIATNSSNISTNSNNINTNKSNITNNSNSISQNKSDISGLSTRLKTVEDALALYLKINDAADLYLTKTVAASTYAAKSTAVTHTANTAVGSSTRPVYVASNGAATALSGTVGSSTEPIYLLNGVFTKISGLSGGISASSLGQNGYVLFSNKFQICWGKNTTSGSNPRTVTLPRNFANTSYAVFSSSAHQDGYGETRAWVVSASQIRVAAYGSGADGDPFYWLAIGQGV